MHVSLDSALGRQRRLNSVGESVLQIAPSAAAAYSLRSLTGGDPKVVRVRRDTDNAEQDFTASEVSASALTSFTNADYAKYTSDFSAGDDSWGSFDDVTETGNIDGIGGLDNNLRLAVGSANSQHRAFRSSILPVNQKFNFSARVFIPSTNSVVDSILIRDAASAAIIASTTPAQDQWVTVTANDVTLGNAQLRINLQDGGSNNFTGNGSDVIYLREVTVTQVTSDGFVETWYDQSGNSKDATQATAGNQPKIVNAGSLLTDGIDFDGTENIGLVTGSFSLTQIYTTFSVSHTDDASTSQGIWSTAASATDNFNATGFFRSDDGFAVNSGATLTTAGTIDYVADRTYLQTNVINGGSSSIFVDGATGKTGNAGSTNPSGVLVIGYFRSSSNNFNLDGGIKELIIYDSDQTSNRAALETNIASANGVTLS